MKRMTALLLSLLMALSLAACGGGSDAPADTDAAGEDTGDGEAIVLRASSSTAPDHPYNLGLEKFAELVSEKTGGAVKIDIFPNAALGDERANMASSSTAPDHPYNLGLEKFAELVSEKTGGAVKIDIFPNAALGDERANIEDLQMGTLDIAVSSTGPLGNFVQDFLILDLPFLFKDYAHAHAVLDGEIGQALSAKLDDIGVVGGAFWENGFREMTNSKQPINSVADCAGLKLRCMENQVHMDAFAALGMDPTPMAWSEVFTALQQGVIDGQENPIAVIYSNKVYEAQEHLAITNHVYSPAMILFSKTVFEGLDPAYQTALLEAAQEAAAFERSACEDSEADQIAEMEAAGMQVTRPDTAEFQAAMAPVYEKYAEQFGQENIDAIVNFEY